MRSIFGKLLFSGLIVSVFLTFGVFAQDLDDVIIGGKIVDTNGLPIVGATVTATLTDINSQRTVVTNEQGQYRFIELSPGTYSIKAVASGFGETTKTDLITISGQNVQLDITLDPAAIIVEPIEVSADDAPVVDITRTVVGGTITQTELEVLPNVSRAPLDFVFTLGGVAEEPLSVRDAAEDRASGTKSNSDPRPAPLESGIFSLSGGAATSNNLTIDGLDNNDDRLAQERFQPSIDAIAEVQVITNQFSAEYGRASGGRVNIRTRGGSKKFRGRAYFFYRNSEFNANTYNNNRRGLEKLPFQDYNPGATFGGPIPFSIFKDKTFFFSSYEYDRFNDTTLIDTIVPVGQNPRFALPTISGGNTRLEDTRNINTAVTGFTPALVTSFVQTVPTPSVSNNFSQRFDHFFTGKHNITVNFEYGNSRNQRQFRNALNRLEEAIIAPSRNTYAIKFTDNLVLTPNLANQFRFQYSKFTPSVGAANPNDPVILISLNDNLTLPANDRRNGTLVAGNSTAATNFNFPGTRRETRFQFIDTFSAVVGNHSLRFGGDVQTIDSAFADTSDATGTFNFPSVSAFLGNRVSQFRRNFGQSSDTENIYYGVYVQDDWRVRSNLTLNFGVRYEGERLVNDNNNFGPRVAAAYSPFKDGKGVIRVGAGIFYNRVLLRTFDDSNLTESRVRYNTTGLAGPNNFSTDVCYVATPSTLNNTQYNSPKCAFLRQVQFPNLLTVDDLRRIEATLPLAANGTRSTGFLNNTDRDLRQIDPNLDIPESYQFNVGFEREIFNGVVFETNYTYNKTVRLFREVNINAYRLPSGFADYNDYLVRGNTNPIFVFFNGAPSDPAVTTTGGITRVNLNTSDPARTVGSAFGIAEAQLLAQVGRRTDSGFDDNIEQVVSAGRSLYNGLTIELRKRFRKIGYGFSGSFRSVYTLSRFLDDGLNPTTNSQITGDFNSDFSLSRQDRRHRFALSGTLDTPNKFGGFRFSPILRLASASRFDLGTGNDRNLNDNSNDRPNFTGDIKNLRFREPGKPLLVGINQFSLAPIGSAGNLPRNAGKGPGQFIFDLNVGRDFRFSERFRLRPNVEFDNIFNARVFTFGSEFINLASGANNSDFLVPTRTLRARQIRLGIRFEF